VPNLIEGRNWSFPAFGFLRVRDNEGPLCK
jgi:hypothetical protein